METSLICLFIGHEPLTFQEVAEEKYWIMQYQIQHFRRMKSIGFHFLKFHVKEKTKKFECYITIQQVLLKY